ncbi:hypothetical protein HPP92_015042 [Vanilla planifolia]|uniref:RING-type domain-containing protein n=1 Tax=Vanilla planifolia TaxID=51239 RepID=A0A835UUQ6_VANPL|nr:hypothetical protein HPP92_015042 [Vanilla planifolia]
MEPCIRFSGGIPLTKRKILQIKVFNMEVGLQTGGKQQVDIHYVNAPMHYVVEENFGGYHHEQDDVTYAQILQDQESVYRSLQRNSETDTARSSRNSSEGDPVDTLQRPESPSKKRNIESQLAIDEAYARELQELEYQLSHTSLNGTSGIESDFMLGQPSTINQVNVGNDTVTQAVTEDDVDPDRMTYQELQSLGEAIGTESRGLSDELICYLPTSKYKTGLFSREKHDECVICRMAYKNRDKLIILPCKHQYHKSCISRWLKINKVCPICNEEVFGS